MRAGGVRLKPDGFAAVAHECLHKRPVAGPHIEDCTRRERSMQAGGKRGARAAQHGVPEAGEPAA
jgi:hypothetical protein